MLSLWIISLAVLLSIMGAFASLMMKKGAARFNFRVFEQLKNWQLIIGVMLFLLGWVPYVYMLKTENLSLIYPFTSLTYVWVALLSLRFLGEKMNRDKWIGIALIMLGITLISYFSL